MIIGVNVQTTGLDPKQARLVELGAVGLNFKNQLGFARYSLVNPGEVIPEETVRIHGISSEKAEAEGGPVEDALEMLERMLAWAHERQYGVAVFNAGYAWSLLRAEALRIGAQPLVDALGAAFVIDPMVIDKQFDRRKGKRNLPNQLAHYQIPDPHNWLIDQEVGTPIAKAVEQAAAVGLLAVDLVLGYELHEGKDWPVKLHAQQVKWAEKQRAYFGEAKESWPFA